MLKKSYYCSLSFFAFLFYSFNFWFWGHTQWFSDLLLTVHGSLLAVLRWPFGVHWVSHMQAGTHPLYYLFNPHFSLKIVISLVILATYLFLQFISCFIFCRNGFLSWTLFEDWWFLALLRYYDHCRLRPQTRVEKTEVSNSQVIWTPEIFLKIKIKENSPNLCSSFSDGRCKG